ncbi:poly(A) RNA polymerase cid11 isoform X1 [Asparagus officinalis]|uniref:poly(A) RNA polymerase cid11 isoform X1 n=1 Tax=Asparagus officinalis TaxID=4686 RepID=UPI00098E5E8A|nr:poly(A) RNA polymerase cid11 isoform X1 [Asparagus officinalis]
MELGQAGTLSRSLCKRAVKLELDELNTIRFSPEFVFALESCFFDIYEILRPRPGEYEQREALVRAFNLLAKDAFGNNKGFPVVEAFGSFTMDLFTAGSDLDLSVNFSNDYTTEFPRPKKISELKKFTRFLYKVQRKGHISKIIPILGARVPVVKVIDSGTGIECDVSVENKDGVSRSSIFTIVSSIDGRFQILSYLMKAWAKAYDINSSKDRTMSSLSVISLVAFHLQTQDPPILPPFSALLRDGTDVSSIQKVAVGFKHFGSRNKESVAKLFITLLIKLSAVEGLWSQGLSASTFEGSWMATGTGNMSIEDFLDRSQNVARSVGKAEMKKIYNCIWDSLNFFLSLMRPEIGEIELKKQLFGFFALNDSSNHQTSEQMSLKRLSPFHGPDIVNPITAKRMRYTDDLHYFNPPAPFQEPPIPLNNLSNFSLPLNPLAPFKPSHREHHINPFETSHLGQPQSSLPPQLAYLSVSSHVGCRQQYHNQAPSAPHLSYQEEHWKPPVPHQFSSVFDRYQADRDLNPGFTDHRVENRFTPYQLNGPDCKFPHFQHL